MAKELLNEAERFLLDNWAEARLLEDSMESVRTKYVATLQRVSKAVAETHPELDAGGVFVPQSPQSSTTGSIGFGRKEWPCADPKWPAGFWVDHVKLEELTDDGAPSPCAGVWVSPKAVQQAYIGLAAARKMLVAGAEEMMQKDEFGECTKSKLVDEYLLAIPIVSKRELLTMLAEGDGEKFVAYFVSLFDSLARFIPALDQVFGIAR